MRFSIHNFWHRAAQSLFPRAYTLTNQHPRNARQPRRHGLPPPRGTRSGLRPTPTRAASPLRAVLRPQLQYSIHTGIDLKWRYEPIQTLPVVSLIPFISNIIFESSRPQSPGLTKLQTSTYFLSSRWNYPHNGRCSRGGGELMYVVVGSRLGVHRSPWGCWREELQTTAGTAHFSSFLNCCSHHWYFVPGPMPNQ
jgi:hypothetical protein